MFYAGQFGTFDSDDEFFKKNWQRGKAPIYVVAALVILNNIIEKMFFGGTRLVVAMGGFSWQLHFALFNIFANSIWFHIINNAVLNVSTMIWFYMWAKYGDSDMSLFKTHGPFKPGLKRFKS